MNDTLLPQVVDALKGVSLRCVECSALYPAIEAGQPPRYRCECGGVLDVEMTIPLSSEQMSPTQDPLHRILHSSRDIAPPAGAMWRQLFDERAMKPPLWSIDTGDALLDASGVWRYRELILPVSESYVVSRPEGNTSLYPVGMENCGSGRAGHRQIGIYAGLEQFYLKHEGENPTGSFK